MLFKVVRSIYLAIRQDGIINEIGVLKSIVDKVIVKYLLVCRLLRHSSQSLQRIVTMTRFRHRDTIYRRLYGYRCSAYSVYPSSDFYPFHPESNSTPLDSKAVPSKYLCRKSKRYLISDDADFVDGIGSDGDSFYDPAARRRQVGSQTFTNRQLFFYRDKIVFQGNSD